MRDKAILELLYSTIQYPNYCAERIRSGSPGFKLTCTQQPRAKNTRWQGCSDIMKEYLDMVERLCFVKRPSKPCLSTQTAAGSTTGFWKIVKYYTSKANIQKDITPHTLRHSFAAHLVQRAEPNIANDLGHSDMAHPAGLQL